MKKQNIKVFVWGAIAGGIGLSILMFATGWAVRSDTAEKNARVMAQSAVAESLAHICVAQFSRAPDKDKKLAEMKELDAWQQGGFVNDQGWATMPGADSGSSQVASACAQLLDKIQG